MIRIVLLSFFSIFTFVVKSQNVSLDWVHGFGNQSGEISRDVCADQEGNVYSTGYFRGTTDFDPGSSSHMLTSNGLDDIYILKQASDGSLKWALNIGGSGIDQGNSIAVDNQGNVYVTGFFNNTVDFDPGIGISSVTSNGAYDIFIIKLDSMGNLIWDAQMGSVAIDHGTSLDVDSSGNIYITGRYSGSMDVDPGVGTQMLNLSGWTFYNTFMIKLNTSGSLAWAKNIGGTLNNFGTSLGESIHVDGDGNVYTTGFVEGSCDLNPDQGIQTYISNGLDDVFVCKLNNNGGHVWSAGFGGAARDRGFSITADEDGNVYVTGNFQDSVDFDIGNAEFKLYGPGNGDVFIQKLNASGSFVWAGQMGATGGDRGHEITTDKYGNVYTAGIFIGTGDFDPGPSVYTIGGVGIGGLFIHKIDSMGEFKWVETVENQANAYAMDIDEDGNIYVVGDFGGTVDFDIDPNNTFNLTSVGGSDKFVLKLKCNSVYATDEIISCGPYTWIDGKTYASSTNSAVYTLERGFGCDSIVTLDLTVRNVDFGIQRGGMTLTSNQTGASYQWLDCNDDYAIVPGATNKSYTAPSTGTFAVEIRYQGCVDTSACYSVGLVGLSEWKDQSVISIYPNPAKEYITVDVSALNNAFGVTLINASGQVVGQWQFAEQQQVDIQTAFPTGIYSLLVSHENGLERVSVVIE